MIILLKLFWEFFKVGLFSIGGGLATIPFLEEMMRKTMWFSMLDLSNLIAVSECTPGPMGVNMATYVGNLVYGPIGSIVAVCGLVTPSIVIIILIAVFLKNFSKLSAVQNTFAGLRPASTGLIAVACVSVAKISVFSDSVFKETGAFWSAFSVPKIILTILMFIGIKKFKKHPALYIAIAAVVGIIFKF